MRNRGLKNLKRFKKKEEKEKKKQSHNNINKNKKRMILKIVKIYLGLSLALWALWGHFQGSSLCLTSSVCWSLQCLISALTQGGGVGHFFFFSFLGSLVQSRCGEGGMLQTNNTGMCLQCLSPAGPAPAGGAHRSGSTLLRRNRLRPALGCMHLPGLSRSGLVLR